MTPGALALAALALASWRTWALLARDMLLDRIRDDIAPPKSGLRDWLECPYCSGFWVAGAWVTAWDGTRAVTPGIVEWQAGWWAVAALVVVIEMLVDRVTGE